MNAEVGFIRKVLSVVEHYGLTVEHLPSGIDTLSIILDSDQLANGVLTDLVNEIRENVNPDYVHVMENISLIATVGHGMTRRMGTAATLFKALADEVDFMVEKELEIKPARVEGYESKNWILIDYETVIVHVFHPQAREYYDLDKLWADGTEIEFELTED